MKTKTFTIFTILLLSSFIINETYAQNLDSEDEQFIKNLEKSLNEQIDNLNENQMEIIRILNENEVHLGTAAKNIDDSLQSTSKNFWYSAALTNVVTVSLSLFGIIVTLVLTLGPITRKEKTGKKYAIKWIIVGVVIGVLFYFLMLNFQQLF